MYRVRDYVYANRWVEAAKDVVIKFENSIASVPDEFINLFKTSEYNIEEHISDEAPIANPTETKVVEPVVKETTEEPATETTEIAAEEKPVEEENLTTTDLSPEVTDSVEETTIQKVEEEVKDEAKKIFKKVTGKK